VEMGGTMARESVTRSFLMRGKGMDILFLEFVVCKGGKVRKTWVKPFGGNCRLRKPFCSLEVPALLNGASEGKGGGGRKGGTGGGC